MISGPQYGLLTAASIAFDGIRGLPEAAPLYNGPDGWLAADLEKKVSILRTVVYAYEGRSIIRN